MIRTRLGLSALVLSTTLLFSCASLNKTLTHTEWVDGSPRTVEKKKPVSTKVTYDFTSTKLDQGTLTANITRNITTIYSIRKVVETPIIQRTYTIEEKPTARGWFWGTLVVYPIGLVYGYGFPLIIDPIYLLIGKPNETVYADCVTLRGDSYLSTGSRDSSPWVYEDESTKKIIKEEEASPERGNTEMSPKEIESQEIGEITETKKEPVRKIGIQASSDTIYFTNGEKSQTKATDVQGNVTFNFSKQNKGEITLETLMADIGNNSIKVIVK